MLGTLELLGQIELEKEAIPGRFLGRPKELVGRDPMEIR